uniref:Signal peptidase I n=1 Tax=Magnetococcus massalia (strain MO-1) TaxID=451514 RepID=A0A1S7LES8_MAGMO|nr:Signal peptidase I [Candidatus Magnetococcus massalia]
MFSQRSKHIWHGILFLLAGIFMLGSYVVYTGVDGIVAEPFQWGTAAAVGLIIGGFALLWQGRRWFASEHPAIEYYDAIVVALGIAMVIRTFVVEPFKIPSGSMIPTLLVGDYLFVNKVAYGYRLPYSNNRILMGEGPKRGDIAVFEFPMDPAKDYIKRIVGLPGDRIAYQDKRLYVNGQPVKYDLQGRYTYSNELSRPVSTVRFTETIGERAYDILVQPTVPPGHRMQQVVPEGHYFVMGDNRDNSNDSRFWGFVPAHRLVGEAVRLFWSWDGLEGSVRFGRIGQPIL